MSNDLKLSDDDAVVETPPIGAVAARLAIIDDAAPPRPSGLWRLVKFGAVLLLLLLAFLFYAFRYDETRTVRNYVYENVPPEYHATLRLVESKIRGEEVPAAEEKNKKAKKR